MKKILIATVAAASLISLGACGKNNDNPAAANLEAAADNMDDAADNLSGNAEDMVENQADNLHAMADNADDANSTGATDNPATAANVAMGNMVGGAKK